MPISIVFEGKFPEKYFKKNNLPKLISSSSMTSYLLSFSVAFPKNAHH